MAGAVFLGGFADFDEALGDGAGGGEAVGTVGCWGGEEGGLAGMDGRGEGREGLRQAAEIFLASALTSQVSRILSRSWGEVVRWGWWRGLGGWRGGLEGRGK